LWTPIL